MVEAILVYESLPVGEEAGGALPTPSGCVGEEEPPVGEASAKEEPSAAEGARDDDDMRDMKQIMAIQQRMLNRRQLRKQAPAAASASAAASAMPPPDPSASALASAAAVADAEVNAAAGLLEYSQPRPGSLTLKP